MRLSSQEEYGLRCLLRIAANPVAALTIPEISAAEGLSEPYVGKLMRLLRQGGFVRSNRGKSGGYSLTRPAGEMTVGEVLAVLGGQIVSPGFCDQFPGTNEICSRTIDCAMRSLWNAVQDALDGVLNRITIQDLGRSERDMAEWIAREEIIPTIPTVL